MHGARPLAQQSVPCRAQYSAQPLARGDTTALHPTQRRTPGETTTPSGERVCEQARRLFGAKNETERGREAFPGLALVIELPKSCRRELVEPGASVVLRRSPTALEPAFGL